MYSGKFVDLTVEEQKAQVHARFEYNDDLGWTTAEGDFIGSTIEDVVQAMIDFEDAEINSIGDCMSGFCVTPPKLTDFVRKPK